VTSTGVIYAPQTGGGYDDAIRRVDAAGRLSTVPLTGLPQQMDWFSVAVDHEGRLYVVTQGRVHRRGDDGAFRVHASAARPTALIKQAAFDGAGRLFLFEVDHGDGLARVLRRNADGSTTVIAGGGPEPYDGRSVPATSATLGSIDQLSVAPDGSFCFLVQQALSCVDTAGTLSQRTKPRSHAPIVEGGIAADLDVFATALAVDERGMVVAAGHGLGGRLYRIGLDGRIASLSGSGRGDGGPAVHAQVWDAGSPAVDSRGNVYFTTEGAVRRVDAAGTITTYAGTPPYTAVSSWSGSPPVTELTLHDTSLAVDKQDRLLIYDYVLGTGSKLLRVESDGRVTQLAGGGDRYDRVMRGTDASLGYGAIAVGPDGSIYLAVGSSGQGSAAPRIMRLDATGMLRTVAGTGAPIRGGISPDGLGATETDLGIVGLAIAVDATGRVAFMERTAWPAGYQLTERVRTITAGGRIETLAGLEVGAAGWGSPRHRPVPGPLATWTPVYTMAFDPSGNLYLAAELNSVLRLSTDGTLEQVAEATVGHGDYGALTVSLTGRLMFNSGGIRELGLSAAHLAPSPDGGRLRSHWEAAGGRRAFGLPTALTRADGPARRQDFERGSLWWAASTGAHHARGAILRRFEGAGAAAGFLGAPTTDESGTPDGTGRYNHFFNNGSIYWTPATGAHEVRGAIRQVWATGGWERGVLGYPVSDEYAVPGGRRSDFQHGSLRWDSRSGTVAVLP